METKLSEDMSRTLTDNVLEYWKRDGIKSRFLGWIEIHHLAEHFLKICREQNRDPREFDFYSMLDSTLYYEENRAQIDNILGGLESEKENSVVNKLKDYLTEEELKAYTPQQKTVIEETESKTRNLEKKLKQITKKMDEQTFDPDALRKELDEMQRVQTQIYARLEQIPNLNQLILALEKSENFRSIGDAIRPITANLPPQQQPQPKPKNHFTLSGWLKTKHIPLLDLFAACVVTIMFVGASYGIIGWLSFTCWGIIGLSALWLTYVVVVRLVAGGILN
jgi:hypothetical protein